MGELVLRQAVAGDLPRIVELMAQLLDDKGEDYEATPDAYDGAFAKIVEIRAKRSEGWPV
jgi:hypothetical protein